MLNNLGSVIHLLSSNWILFISKVEVLAVIGKFKLLLLRWLYLGANIKVQSIIGLLLSEWRVIIVLLSVYTFHNNEFYKISDDRLLGLQKFSVDTTLNVTYRKYNNDFHVSIPML